MFFKKRRIVFQGDFAFLTIYYKIYYEILDDRYPWVFKAEPNYVGLFRKT